MRFHDLPSDWPQRPITDPDIFDGVIDLIASDKSRADGTLHLLLCHPTGRLMQPVAISGPGPADPTELLEAMTTIFSGFVDMGVNHVAVVMARPGTCTLTSTDLDRRAACDGAGRLTGMTVLGVAVAAPDGVSVIGTEEQTGPGASDGSTPDTTAA